jgi:hypothetical protein
MKYQNILNLNLWRNSLAVWVILGLLTGCSTGGPQNTYRPTGSAADGESRPIIDSQYTLKEDRKVLETLREDVPEAKKNDNDELAFILNLMADQARPPENIRQQFDKALRKKRETFDRDLRKERETFTKKERGEREKFLAELKEVRDNRFRNKMDSKERSEVIKEMDQKRADYFSAEKDRRQDFESDVRERRKNFDDYIRERQNFFNQEYRSYQKSYQERKKAKEQSNLNEAQALEEELREAKSKKSFFLQSGDSN